MISRAWLFSIFFAGLCVWPVAPARSAEANAGSPREELVKVCKEGAPTLAQLKKHYLAWQTQRLVGKLPYPKSDLKEKIRREYSHLTDEQFKKYEAWAEREAQRRMQKANPLGPDELAKLESWFKARPAFREKLLLALDPADDKVPDAVRVALAIREKYPKESESLENLTIAFAVVWDEPETVTKAMVRSVPELRKNPPKPCPYLDSFGWFIQHHRQLCPWFAGTPWRLQVYLANEGISLKERDFALARHKYNPALGTVYSQIDYDMSKVQDHIGRLRGNAYTLENLTKYGGVCRDQAYFARSVCRAFGVPAYMASGTGNTGIGHAWVGWIIRDPQGTYKLESHGRYSYDKYFTAEITDPASGGRIYDYLVGIEAKGLSEEKGYGEADLYYRVWREIGKELDPTLRTKLLTEGLKRNAFHREAWLAVGEATANGLLPPNSANAQWRYLNRNFTEFPDFIFRMANSFAKMYKTPADKYRFYEQTAGLFKRLRRQDLVAKLRLEEAEMCEKEGRKDLAAQVALSGMQECAGEGTHGAALAQKAVVLLSELGKSAALVNPLKNTLAKTPQTRMDRINPNWNALAKLLVQVYKQTGNAKAAASLEQQISRTESTARRKREAN